MKKLLILLFACALCVPSYAQFKMPRSTKGHSHVGKSAKRSKVSASSRRVNAAFRRQIHRISLASAFPTTALKPGHRFERKVIYDSFQLQHTDSPLAPGVTGFAIDLLGDGTVWGVTAGHAARKLTYSSKRKFRSPHIRVKTGPNSFIIAPIDIKTISIGNPEGGDVALFPIPKNVLPYVTVLRPAEHAPLPGEEVVIRGFLEEKNQPFTLSPQKVLFSSALKVLLKQAPEGPMRGFCGAPGFTNGLVSMVYIGFDSAGILPVYDWHKKLPKKTRIAMSGVRHGISIELVKLMAKSIKETGSANQGGLEMKVLGHPVALLHPDESIVYIEQLRNGERIEKIVSDRHCPIDLERLELFFKLEENDTLRIALDSYSPEHQYPDVSIIYDVNVSTGQVTKLTPASNTDPLLESLFQERRP